MFKGNLAASLIDNQESFCRRGMQAAKQNQHAQNAKMVGIPKAADFEVWREEVAIKHEIFQPQVSMEDSLLMAILHTADELLEESALPKKSVGPVCCTRTSA